MKTGVASWSGHDVLGALAWWIEAGVDTAVSDQPASWLRAPDADIEKFIHSPPEKVVAAKTPPSPEPTLAGRAHDQPDSAAVAPIVSGNATAALMLVLDAGPAAALPSDDEQLLLTRMMAAIGIELPSVALLGISGRDRSGQALAHVAAASATTLLLFGDGPARAILGQPVAQARGQIHQLNANGRQLEVVATLAPSFLLRQPQMKPLAWDDLRLFARLVRKGTGQ